MRDDGCSLINILLGVEWMSIEETTSAMYI
jgi:hypothetical protein